jgi:hypothetical protein
MQFEIDGQLFFSRSELRRVGLTARDVRELGDPDTILANPHGYPGSMLAFAAARVLPLLPAGMAACDACGKVHADPSSVTLDNYWPSVIPFDDDDLRLIEAEERAYQASVVGCTARRAA